MQLQLASGPYTDVVDTQSVGHLAVVTTECELVRVLLCAVRVRLVALVDELTRLAVDVGPALGHVEHLRVVRRLQQFENLALSVDAVAHAFQLRHRGAALEARVRVEEAILAKVHLRARAAGVCRSARGQRASKTRAAGLGRGDSDTRAAGLGRGDSDTRAAGLGRGDSDTRAAGLGRGGQ